MLERILFHVADPPGLRVAGRMCTRLAAATAASSPLWRAVFTSHINLSRQHEQTTQ